MTAWDYAKSKGTTLKQMSIASDQRFNTITVIVLKERE